MNTRLAERIDAARSVVARWMPMPVELGCVLGSGLGHLVESVEDPVFISCADIPGLPVSTAPGHAGKLVLGALFGRPCAIMQGRLHLYEGWSAQEIAFPVYLLRALGAHTLIVTNAAGALNPAFVPGDVMLIEDHLNFTGVNPLAGPNDDRVGLRFPDMSRAYDPELRAAARFSAVRAGCALHEGIYAGVAGPSLETSAERRFLRNAGGDAVGMSTVLEAIAAGHAGLHVLGFSAITNSATGGPDQQPDTIEEVLANAAISGVRIERILRDLLPRLPANGRRKGA